MGTLPPETPGTRLLDTGPLGTARLVLEPLRVAHAEEMVDLLADRALYAFYADEASPTLDELRERYTRQVRGRSADGAQEWHNWVLRVRATGEAAGFVQATVTTDEAGAGIAELAWVVGTGFQGQGLATEAASTVRDVLLAAGATAVIAHIAPGHTASETVALRLGLARTDEVDDGEARWQLDTRSSEVSRRRESRR